MASLEQIGEEVVGQARCPFESSQSNVGLFAGESHDPCRLALVDLMLETLVDMNVMNVYVKQIKCTNTRTLSGKNKVFFH